MGLTVEKDYAAGLHGRAEAQRMKLGLSGLVLAAALSLSSNIVFAVDDAGIGTSARDQEYAPWAVLLREFNHDGRVDYRGLAQRPQPLIETLAVLESIQVAEFAQWSAADRMAFWINAYNAYTIRWILNHYPTTGILDTVSLWKRALGSPFNETFIPLGALVGPRPQRLISLATIEHEVLRKKFHDPRIHFAIVCASKSCPKLRMEPYSAAGLDRELDENARDFMRDTTKNRYEAGRRQLVVSKIFKWFSADFDAGGGPTGFFLRFGPPEPAAALAADPSHPVGGFRRLRLVSERMRPWSVQPRSGWVVSASRTDGTAQSDRPHPRAYVADGGMACSRQNAERRVGGQPAIAFLTAVAAKSRAGPGLARLAMASAGSRKTGLRQWHRASPR